MKKLFVRLTTVASLSLVSLASAVPAFAQENGAGDGGGTDISTVVIWSLVGVGVFMLALGILYLFKRQVGGFPENPLWVAPISITRSRDLPSEPHEDSHEDTLAHPAPH